MEDKICTTSGNDPANPVPGAPDGIDQKTGQHKDYYVICEEDRKKGFIRPIRNSYIHLKCGVVTKMSQAISETYARNPNFYGATFCVHCRDHFPVGENGEFVWDGTNEKVGS
jgi:hypothetical protein